MVIYWEDRIKKLVVQTALLVLEDECQSAFVRQIVVLFATDLAAKRIVQPGN